MSPSTDNAAAAGMNGQAPAGQQARISRVFVWAGLALCLYLLWPALGAVHLEGFTAQTESIAMLMSRAPGLEHDPYLPLVSQFIYQTRSAVIDALALIYQVFPDAGDAAFKALVLASFVSLLAASVLFARRWGKVPALFALFALVLTQGIPETAFFFNDNIVSAALASIALVLISPRSGAASWLLSGLLMGLAILSRVDAVFMAPMILGTVFFSFSETRKRLAAIFLGALAATAVLVASAVYHGFSLLDAFFVATRFVVTVDHTRWLATIVWVRVLFIGLSAFPLLVVGLLISLQRFKGGRSYIGALTFVVYPVLLAIFAPKATEVRYIFPLLSPMMALHVGAGLHWVYRQLAGDRGGRPFRYAIAIAIFSTLVALVPPTQVMMSDGPRALLGRLWTPIYWKRWQASVEESTRRSNSLVGALDNQKTNLLISTHYNDEFYMRLRLIEAGFIPVAASRDFPGCKGFSLLKKGGSTVAHVRTDPQYRIAPLTVEYNAAMQISSALKCSEFKSFGKAYISTFGDNQRGMPSEVYGISPLSFGGPLTVEFSDVRTRMSPYNPHLVRDYGLIDFRELSAQEIASLKDSTGKYLQAHDERDPKTGNVVTIDAYENYYRPAQGPTSGLLTGIRDDLKAATGN